MPLHPGELGLSLLIRGVDLVDGDFMQSRIVASTYAVSIPAGVADISLLYQVLCHTPV